MRDAIAAICAIITGAQPKAGTGHKMQTVSVVFSTGLKNRWLAEEFLQGRVHTTLTADFLRGLEALEKILSLLAAGFFSKGHYDERLVIANANV